MIRLGLRWGSSGYDTAHFDYSGGEFYPSLVGELRSHMLCDVAKKKKKKSLKWSDWYKNEFECLYKIDEWKIMP